MESEVTYTNEEILSLCEFGNMADSMGPVTWYLRYPEAYAQRRKNSNDRTPAVFTFNEWILSLKRSKKKFSDRRWKRIYNMLYLEPIDNMPLYINSKKLYVKDIAKWRMSLGK